MAAVIGADGQVRLHAIDAAVEQPWWRELPSPSPFLMPLRPAALRAETWQGVHSLAERNLQTEPWIFVVDGQGIVRAKFEGLTTACEIEAVLQQLLE